MDDRAHVTNVFNEHNNEVIRRLPGRLLVFEADRVGIRFANSWPTGSRSTTRGQFTEDFENSSPQGSKFFGQVAACSAASQHLDHNRRVKI